MLTQGDYKLYTGETVNYADDDWQKLVELASGRLASFLCLAELPADKKGALPTDLTMLLANFLCLMLESRGKNLQVASKHIRNFTIDYQDSSATNAFTKLQENYSDIIAKYSACGKSFAVESNAPRCCNGCF